MTRWEKHKDVMEWLYSEEGREVRVYNTLTKQLGMKVHCTPVWDIDKTYLPNDKHIDIRIAHFKDEQLLATLGKIWFIWDSATKLDFDRFEYRLKEPEWFELESSIGKLVWVKDKDCDEWRTAVFQKYNKNMIYKYSTNQGSYELIEPATTEDLI